MLAGAFLTEAATGEMWIFRQPCNYSELFLGLWKVCLSIVHVHVLGPKINKNCFWWSVITALTYWNWCKNETKTLLEICVNLASFVQENQNPSRCTQKERWKLLRTSAMRNVLSRLEIYIQGPESDHSFCRWWGNILFCWKENWGLQWTMKRNGLPGYKRFRASQSQTYANLHKNLLNQFHTNNICIHCSLAD